MTIGSQVKQTTASLKGVKATLDLYSRQTAVEKEKEIFERNSKKVAKIIEVLEQRIAQLEFEEPQYRGF